MSEGKGIINIDSILISQIGKNQNFIPFSVIFLLITSWQLL